MADGERKSRLHIHLGGLVILILFTLILFKVDIKSKINSPQFQENYTYIEESIKSFWQKYISGPIKERSSDFFVDFTNTQLDKIQSNFTKNVLKTDNIDTEMKKYDIE